MTQTEEARARRAVPELARVLDRAQADPFDDLVCVDPSLDVRRLVVDTVSNMRVSAYARWCRRTRDLYRWLTIRYRCDDTFAALEADEVRYRVVDPRLREEIAKLRDDISRQPFWCFQTQEFQLKEVHRSQAVRYSQVRRLREILVQSVYEIKPIENLTSLPAAFDYPYLPDEDGRALLGYSLPLPPVDPELMDLSTVDTSPSVKLLLATPFGELGPRKVRMTVERQSSEHPDLPDRFLFRADWRLEVPPDRELECQCDVIAVVAGNALYYTRLTPRHFVSVLRGHCSSPPLPLRSPSLLQRPGGASPSSAGQAPPGGDDEWSAPVWSTDPASDQFDEEELQTRMSLSRRRSRLNRLLSAEDREWQGLPLTTQVELVIDALEFYDYIRQPRPSGVSRKRRISEDPEKRTQSVSSELGKAVDQLYCDFGVADE